MLSNKNPLYYKMSKTDKTPNFQQIWADDGSVREGLDGEGIGLEPKKSESSQVSINEDDMSKKEEDNAEFQSKFEKNQDPGLTLPGNHATALAKGEAHQKAPEKPAKQFQERPNPDKKDPPVWAFFNQASEENPFDMMDFQEKKRDNAVLAIKGVAPSTEKKAIEDVFKVFGEIEGIYIFEGKGYAYIHFKVTSFFSKRRTCGLLFAVRVFGWIRWFCWWKRN